MPYIDLSFRVSGSTLPVDHGYALYSAICHHVHEIHDSKEIGVHPIRGHYSGRGDLLLTERSHLTLRMPDERIRTYLKLAGKTLDVDGYKLRVGVPETRAIIPAAVLYSRLATIKKFMEPEPFLDAAMRQTQEMKIAAELRLGERRTLRIKDKQVVGFEILAIGLTAEDSIRLQEVGIGGRRRMGCGIFVLARKSRIK